MKKKGQIGTQFQALIPIILFFLFASLLAMYGLDIVEDQREDFCDYNYDEGDGACRSCPVGYTYSSSDDNCQQSINTSNTTTYTDQMSRAFNGTLDTEAGIAKIPEKMPTMGSVAVAVIIISLLFAGFGGFLLARRFG